MARAMTAADICVGDVILPPEREIRLWMRRRLIIRRATVAA